MTDILIKQGFLLTMQGEGVGVIEDGAVAIEGSRIEAIGKTHDIEKRHSGAEVVFDARGKAVLPGFVDAHIHVLKLPNLINNMQCAANEKIQ